MKHLLLGSLLVAATAALAAPVVSDVTLTQDADRTVSIHYTLSGEAGIVTVDIQTNSTAGGWISIGGEHLTYFAGDANRIVQPGARAITWKPRKAWADNLVTENVRAVLSAWSLTAPPDYLVISLSAPNGVNFYTCAEAVPFGVTNDLYKTDCLLMRKCPAANVQWRMGSPSTEAGRVAAREVPHLVTLSEDFYIGVYQFTQRQYEIVNGGRGSNFNNDADYATRPVEKVSWEALRGSGSPGQGYNWPVDGYAVNPGYFMAKIRALSGLPQIDLPTDAQWEFACRAGCGNALYSGQELDSTTDSARVNALGRTKFNGGLVNGSQGPAANCSAANGTAKVGSYAPNAWGIYDMYGNVHEWCRDRYQENLTDVDGNTGPASTGDLKRVIRGGSWDAQGSQCRSGARDGVLSYNNGANIGFRLFCPAGFAQP